MGASEGLKTCPQCAEDVKAAARVCRYCSYTFTDVPQPKLSEAERRQAFAPVAAAVKQQIKQTGMFQGKVSDETPFSIEYVIRDPDEVAGRAFASLAVGGLVGGRKGALTGFVLGPNAPKRRWKLSIDEHGQVHTQSLGKVRYWQEGGTLGGPTQQQRKVNPAKGRRSDALGGALGIFFTFAVIRAIFGWRGTPMVIGLVITGVLMVLVVWSNLATGAPSKRPATKNSKRSATQNSMGYCEIDGCTQRPAPGSPLCAEHRLTSGT